MERLSESILRQARQQPEGMPVTAKGLLHLGSRAAVDQALSRLTRRGALLRVGRGNYVVPVESRFGRRAPSAEKTVSGLAARRGERISTTGAVAANALGLTTQVPVKSIYLTSGPSRRFTLGRQEVELRHAPSWQFVLGDSKAGQVVRALAWLGPEKVETVIGRMQGELNAEERTALSEVVGRLPGWLAASISRLAYG